MAVRPGDPGGHQPSCGRCQCLIPRLAVQVLPLAVTKQTRLALPDRHRPRPCAARRDGAALRGRPYADAQEGAFRGKVRRLMVQYGGQGGGKLDALIGRPLGCGLAAASGLSSAARSSARGQTLIRSRCIHAQTRGRMSPEGCKIGEGRSCARHGPAGAPDAPGASRSGIAERARDAEGRNQPRPSLPRRVDRSSARVFTLADSILRSVSLSSS